MKYKYFLCQFCTYGRGKECSKCESDMLFKSIKFFSTEETLNELIDNKKSIARFGDGEFAIIFGNDISFQKFNKKLKKKLLYVLNSNVPNLLVGIIPLYKNKNSFWINWISKYKFKMAKIIINKHKKYCNSAITRFYNSKSNRTLTQKYVNKFKKIWNNRNILIIEGDKTRLGIGNDLLNNAKSIKRIICPAENAFDVYDEILKYVTYLNIDKHTLILISLGPTATVLAHDFVKLGNQVIDFGHFDIQYEYFLRNTKKAIKIPNKYVNEIMEGRRNISPSTDKKYLSQIIHKINILKK